MRRPYWGAQVLCPLPCSKDLRSRKDNIIPKRSSVTSWEAAEGGACSSCYPIASTGGTEGEERCLQINHNKI
ncbi:hypothetical protein E2C01_082870 [Portunus trituberculatus]|uniref:Uncharacterized protein n=1 Tax=Portunus trituberculatus TaxID=210409 RepID=A0A5B7IVP3_PORTR|nr:hypothetical protein [Portunus trituberculatus]